MTGEKIFKCPIDKLDLGNEIIIEDRRRILTDILKYIDKVCEKKQLRYFIAYGSLLGTVRHKGFIPWDDDIDIWVPIEDYEKLLEIIEIENLYAVGNNIKDDNWYLNFAKVSDKHTVLIDEKQSNFTYKGSTQRGVAVDIFPLFEIDKKKSKKIEKCIKKRRLCYWYKHDYLKGWKKAVMWGTKILGWSVDKFTRQLLEIEKQKTKSGLIGCPMSPYLDKDKYPNEWFEMSVKLDFEDFIVHVPKGYHDILTKLYGDYMTPPPEEERRELYHNIKAYWVK